MPARFPLPFRPTVARIDLSAVTGNFRILRSLTNPAGVCAVVKANAYGHGMLPVARCLAQEGCQRYAVATVDEGLELRQGGVSGEVWVLQGAAPAHVGAVLEAGLTPVVSDLARLEGLGREADRRGRRLEVHLKFDTGMGRLGLDLADAAAAVTELRRHAWLALAGVATHFARAGECREATRTQLGRFQQVLDALRSLGVDPGVVHAANSAACLTEPEARFDCVRVGIALYGAAPEPGLLGGLGFRPALTWESAVDNVRDVPAGTAVSYGGTFVTSRPSRLAVVPVGYADGYRRALGNRAQLLVRGLRAPVVGRVTMDMAIADVTDVPGVAAGDEVVLLGSQGRGSITAEEMAGWLDSIPYEVFCAIGQRVPRAHGGPP